MSFSCCPLVTMPLGGKYGSPRAWDQNKHQLACNLRFHPWMVAFSIQLHQVTHSSAGSLQRISLGHPDARPIILEWPVWGRGVMRFLQTNATWAHSCGCLRQTWTLGRLVPQADELACVLD